MEAMCYVEYEDVVGAAPTGNAATTSERSTILLPNVCLIIRGLTVVFFIIHQCILGSLWFVKRIKMVFNLVST